jgi:hypothetical protein
MTLAPATTRLAAPAVAAAAAFFAAAAPAAARPAAGPATSESRDVASTAGLAVAVEAGRYRGGYGGALAYHQPVAAWPRFVVGAGVNAGISGFEPHAPAWGANLFAAFGGRHRMLVLAGWALNDRSVLRLHGADAAERMWWGPEASAGYELVTAVGLTARLLIGVAYAARGSIPAEDRYRRTTTLSVGWKLW